MRNGGTMFFVMQATALSVEKPRTMQRVRKFFTTRAKSVQLSNYKILEAFEKLLGEKDLTNQNISTLSTTWKTLSEKGIVNGDLSLNNQYMNKLDGQIVPLAEKIVENVPESDRRALANAWLRNVIGSIASGILALGSFISAVGYWVDSGFWKGFGYGDPGPLKWSDVKWSDGWLVKVQSLLFSSRPGWDGYEADEKKMAGIFLGVTVVAIIATCYFGLKAWIYGDAKRLVDKAHTIVDNNQKQKQ